MFHRTTGAYKILRCSLQIDEIEREGEIRSQGQQFETRDSILMMTKKELLHVSGLVPSLAD